MIYKFQLKESVSQLFKHYKRFIKHLKNKKEEIQHPVELFLNLL